MDASFVDLDILLTRIRNHQSRTYFLDAVRAYKAGALRAALTSTWVAVAYDLIAKYRELSANGDAAATTFIQGWDQATAIRDLRRLLTLEGDIVDHATTSTQVISQVARTQLVRLREDRHLCAHPAFSAEAELFEPTPELVRMHLVNAVDLVLSREPLQGGAILKLFDADVQSAGFPTPHGRILDYVEQRYLARVRPQNIRNLGVVLAKSLLKGTPPQWEAVRSKVISSLVAVRERAPGAWPDLAVAIARLIEQIEPPNRPRAIAFIAALPEFWGAVDQPTRTALEATAQNTTAANLTDYRMLAGLALEPFRTPLLAVVNDLERDGLAQAIAAGPMQELWPVALARYVASAGWRSSEANFRDLIAPFAPSLDAAQLDALLDAVAENGQNWDAGDTPSLLSGLLRNTGGRLPSQAKRDEFYQFLRRVHRANAYEDALTAFQSDGWVAPAVAQAAPDDDIPGL